jgi:hypothetical protein
VAKAARPFVETTYAKTDRAKIAGQAGRWSAVVTYPDGQQEELGCVHQHFFKGMQYSQPAPAKLNIATRGLNEYRRCVDLIKAKGLVIITVDSFDDRRPLGDGSFKRTGYVGVFEVTNLIEDEKGFSFDLVRPVIRV